MDIITLVSLSIGLAMDAFAVSISNGMSIKNITTTKILIVAFAFGAFQGLMPIIGYYSGILFSDFISSIDHYIALITLSFLGLKMIKDGFYEKYGNDNIKSIMIFSLKLLIIQSIATSIDALAVGINFIAFDVNIFMASSLIFIITFIFCIIGGYIGRLFKDALASYATIFGGVILITIGIKIFITHII